MQTNRHRQTHRQTGGLATGNQTGVQPAADITSNQSVNMHFVSSVNTTKAAVRMGRTPQERQGSVEQATMDTDEHDAEFSQLNVIVQMHGHAGKHMVCICPREAMMLHTLSMK